MKIANVTDSACIATGIADLSAPHDRQGGTRRPTRKRGGCRTSQVRFQNGRCCCCGSHLPWTWSCQTFSEVELLQNLSLEPIEVSFLSLSLGIAPGPLTRSASAYRSSYAKPVGIHFDKDRSFPLTDVPGRRMKSGVKGDQMTRSSKILLTIHGFFITPISLLSPLPRCLVGAYSCLLV